MPRRSISWESFSLKGREFSQEKESDNKLKSESEFRELKREKEVI